MGSRQKRPSQALGHVQLLLQRPPRPGQDGQSTRHLHLRARGVMRGQSSLNPTVQEPPRQRRRSSQHELRRRNSGLFSALVLRPSDHDNRRRHILGRVHLRFSKSLLPRQLPCATGPLALPSLPRRLHRCVLQPRARGMPRAGPGVERNCHDIPQEGERGLDVFRQGMTTTSAGFASPASS